METKQTKKNSVFLIPDTALLFLFWPAHKKK